MQSYILTFSLFFVFLFPSVAQDSLEDWVFKGIEYHELGQYDKAIETYKKALKIDKKSSLALYEMAYSYFAKKDYKNAIKYSGKVIKINKEHLLAAYLINGSALDLNGKTEKGIQILEKASKKYPTSHLVYYNLGVNYAKIAKYKASVKALETAISNESNHTSSHLTIAQIQLRLGKKAKAALSYYYFLLLEPDSPRSNIAFDNLHAIMNPPKNNEGGINISLVLDETEDNTWTMRDFMVSSVGLVKDETEDKKLTEAEKFAKNTKTIFNIFKEGMEGKITSEVKLDIYDALYIPMINQVLSADAVKTFAFYISQRQGEEQENWLKEHKKEVDQLLVLFE